LQQKIYLNILFSLKYKLKIFLFSVYNIIKSCIIYGILELNSPALAYCLMPTHFHFLVYIVSTDISKIQKNIGIWLSSYTKAINKLYKRHGSLFQHHTKAVLISSDNYLLTAAAYIHQNPVVSGLVDKHEDWTYSSYQDYIEMRDGSLPKTEIIKNQFSSLQEFIEFSHQNICDDDLSAII